MRLKSVAVLLAVGLLAAPVAAEAQRAGKVYRIGYLGNTPFTPSDQPDAFAEGLQRVPAEVRRVHVK